MFNPLGNKSLIAIGDLCWGADWIAAVCVTFALAYIFFGPVQYNRAVPSSRLRIGALVGVDVAIVLGK